jgi:hypothetical protein
MRVALTLVVRCAGITAVLAHEGYGMEMLNRLLGNRDSASAK